MRILHMFRLKAFFILLLKVPLALSAQEITHVLTHPEHLLNPFDYYDQPERMRRWQANDSKVTSDKWVVYSDRDNNKVYDKPGGKVLPVKLGFMEACYVVNKTNDGWLQLIRWDGRLIDGSGTKIQKNKRAQVQELGWVHRDHLLLWRRSLIDERSKVGRKAIIINVGEQGAIDVLQSQIGDSIPVYFNPDGRGPKAGPRIYDFFHILKKEGDFYLLSRDESFSPMQTEAIVGWVNKVRVFPWDTRLVLEPNVYEEAFQERQANPDFRVVHYRDPAAARNHHRSGQRQSAGVLREADPASSRDPADIIPFSFNRSGVKGGQESVISMRRFEGENMRFPILEMSTDKAYYATAVVGDIQTMDIAGKIRGSLEETGFARVEKMTEEARDASLQWNVIFLVEGTLKVAPYKSQVLAAVDAFRQYAVNLDSDVQMRASAIVYRDIEDEARGLLIQEFRKDTPERIRSELARVDFAALARINDDEPAAMLYGIEQALNRGAFVEGQVNILVHIGAFGDISTDINRRQSGDRNHEAMLNDARLNRLYEKMGDYRVHTIALQVSDNEGRAASKFSEGMWNVILTSAQNARSRNRNDSKNLMEHDLKGNPTMLAPSETEYLDGKPASIVLSGSGLSRSFLYTPGKGMNAGVTDFQQQVASFLDDLRIFIQKRNQSFVQFSEGKALQELDDVFQEAVVDELRRTLSGRFTKDDFQKLSFKKFKLMFRSYVPVSVKGMVHPLHSYVVIMESRVLQNHIDRLNLLNQALTADPSVRRERLYEAMFNLCGEAYLSERRLSKADFGRMSYDEFSRLINGIQDEGVDIRFPVNWQMKDILNHRVVSDSEINDYALHVASSHGILNNRILRGNYPYKFKRNGIEYFWIPIDFTL